MQQQATMVSMVTSSIHPSAFSTKNQLELKGQLNWTAVHQLSHFLPQLGKGFFMRPQSTIPWLHQFEIKQPPNQLCNNLPRISIIAMNLQIPFPHNMEHRWRTMIVMSIFPLVFSNENWIALQWPSNNFTWLKICMLPLGLGLRLHQHQSNEQNLKGLLD